jgi:hypothetical protein
MSTMTRRSFAQTVGMGVAAVASMGSLLTMTGCNFLTDLVKYIPVAIQAVTGILSVLSGGGIGIPPLVSTVLGDVKAAFADLSADIEAYQNAPADSKATLLAKVSEALSIVEGNVQQFWNDLNIPDGIIATVIAGVLSVVVSTLSYFAAQLPPPAPTPALNAMRQKRMALAKTINVPSKKRTLGQFKSDLNTAFGDTGVRVY